MAQPSITFVNPGENKKKDEEPIRDPTYPLYANTWVLKKSTTAENPGRIFITDASFDGFFAWLDLWEKNDAERAKILAAHKRGKAIFEKTGAIELARWKAENNIK